MDIPTAALSIAILLPLVALIVLFILSSLTPWPRHPVQYSTSLAKRAPYIPPTISGDERPGGEPVPFPALLQWNEQEGRPNRSKPSLYLSVVVPCKNEARRLPHMLDECLDYLHGRGAKDERFSYELIVVDDGSADNTADVAYAYSRHHPQLKVLRLPRNAGKGGAVREGVLCARGQLVLFADADGATRFADFAALEKEMWQLCNGDSVLPFTQSSSGGGKKSQLASSLDWTHPGVVVGSRAHLEAESKAKRSLFRTFLMIGFHLLVRLLAVKSIRDTQCGFKLFTRAAAAKLFPRLHLERWAFDVELLYLAESLNFSLKEVGVEWKEIGGSQLTPVLSWLQMGRDILLVWFRYNISGEWKVNDFSE